MRRDIESDIYDRIIKLWVIWGSLNSRCLIMIHLDACQWLVLHVFSSPTDGWRQECLNGIELWRLGSDEFPVERNLKLARCVGLIRFRDYTYVSDSDLQNSRRHSQTMVHVSVDLTKFGHPLHIPSLPKAGYVVLLMPGCSQRRYFLFGVDVARWHSEEWAGEQKRRANQSETDSEKPYWVRSIDT